MIDWFNGEYKLERCSTAEHWVCPACHSGHMIFTGESFMTTVPGHFHKCDACGTYKAARGQKFPRSDSQPA